MLTLQFAGLGVILVGVALTGLMMARNPESAAALFTLQLLLVAGGITVALLSYLRVRRCLLEPMDTLRQWARRMREGDLSARMPIPRGGELTKLALDVNNLSEELQTLSQDMQSRVVKHTRRLAQKTRSLEILYELAANLNAARDLDDLLTRFLHTLKDVVDAHAATVRLLDDDGQMRLVASLGLDPDFVDRENRIPVNQCLCGSALAQGEILCQHDIGQCAKGGTLPLNGHGDAHMLAVPLRYQDRTLGVYNLFVDHADLALKDELDNLLSSIGRHLGMAIEKARLDKESQRLSIMQERTLLAHELHDSLAQTLASLRFQVKMLEQTLEQSVESEKVKDARQEVLRIRNGLEEANTELRELLAHFRAPIDKRGLIPAIEGVIERFRRQSGITVFFQRQCSEVTLPANQEMQVLRILQESLTNIGKHSGAVMVRVMLRCNDEGNYRLLIEDDGVGMPEPDTKGHPGEHLGLIIMQERAKRLGGRLTIDSEPGEGTQIELTFRHSRRRLSEIPVRPA
ncbi:hypothetical protein JCM17961_20380 [Endothiovibrio diazotrophicus]